jgi:hypothetical protein
MKRHIQTIASTTFAIIIIFMYCITTTHADGDLINTSITTKDVVAKNQTQYYSNRHNRQHHNTIYISNQQEQQQKKLLRGPATIIHPYDDDEQDLNQYILDYECNDIQYNRKLVTIFDRSRLQLRRNIVNTTWIVVLNRQSTSNSIVIKLLRRKMVSRINLVLNAIVVKGITRNTLGWLLQQPDVTFIEEV